MAAADGLIVGSPVYKAAYSGVLKTFLPDPPMILVVGLLMRRRGLITHCFPGAGHTCRMVVPLEGVSRGLFAEFLVAGESDSGGEEGAVVAGLVLVSSGESAVAEQPCDGSFDHSTVLAEPRIFNTALIRKSPGKHVRYATVGLHCDAAYWRTCSSWQMLTAWVPWQDTTAATAGRITAAIGG